MTQATYHFTPLLSLSTSHRYRVCDLKGPSSLSFPDLRASIPTLLLITTFITHKRTSTICSTAECEMELDNGNQPGTRAATETGSSLYANIHAIASYYQETMFTIPYHPSAVCHALRNNKYNTKLPNQQAKTPSLSLGQFLAYNPDD
jgi:hypothetical protein